VSYTSVTPRQVGMVPVPLGEGRDAHHPADAVLFDRFGGRAGEPDHLDARPQARGDAGQVAGDQAEGFAAVQEVFQDLAAGALDDVDPAHVVLATRAGDRSRLVAAFRRCAQERLTGPALAADAAADAAPA
jgi:hypothetical protein